MRLLRCSKLDTAVKTGEWCIATVVMLNKLGLLYHIATPITIKRHHPTTTRRHALSKKLPPHRLVTLHLVRPAVCRQTRIRPLACMTADSQRGNPPWCIEPVMSRGVYGSTQDAWSGVCIYPHSRLTWSRRIRSRSGVLCAWPAAMHAVVRACARGVVCAVYHPYLCAVCARSPCRHAYDAFRCLACCGGFRSV